MAIDAQTLFVALSVFLIAGMVKGVLGFGLPIITMSLLPFLLPVEQAIVLSAVVQPATNIFQFVTSGLYKQATRIAMPVLFALVPGVAIGAMFLTRLDSNTLLLLVGLTIGLFSLNELLGKGIKIPSAYRIQSGLGFGFIAGVFGALTALNGWAFIMYLMGIGTNRQEFRSAIALLFLVSGLLISSSFWAVGILDAGLLLIGMLAVVPSFLGMWIGDNIGKKMPAQLFRKLLLLSLVAIGAMIALRGLGLIG